ncbi:MAG: hypothetical protein AB7V04_12975 [Desulfomonilaceae bacterium]
MSSEVWQIMWINIVLQFATAWWFVSILGKGSWSSSELKRLLPNHACYLAPRSASNAIMELLGLFERSPIGQELGQGVVSGHSPRSVKRIGLSTPSSAASNYSAFQLFLMTGSVKLSFDNHIPWPWVVFGCDKDYVISQIITNKCDWIEITSDEIVCRDIDKGASHVMDLLGLHRGS